MSLLPTSQGELQPHSTHSLDQIYQVSVPVNNLDRPNGSYILLCCWQTSQTHFSSSRDKSNSELCMLLQIAAGWIPTRMNAFSHSRHYSISDVIGLRKHRMWLKCLSPRNSKSRKTDQLTKNYMRDQNKIPLHIHQNG